MIHLESYPSPAFINETSLSLIGDHMPIEEEIVHWWKGDKGESHRNALRLESESPQMANGFPRDGLITLRIMNSVSAQAIKLSPDEALRISTQLLTVAKELINDKRALWKNFEE